MTVVGIHRLNPVHQAGPSQYHCVAGDLARELECTEPATVIVTMDGVWRCGSSCDNERHLAAVLELERVDPWHDGAWTLEELRADGTVLS